MKEIIARINSNEKDIEIAYVEGMSSPAFKKITSEKFIEIVNSTIRQKSPGRNKNLRIMHPEIIARNDYYTVVKQEQRKRIVNYIEHGQNTVYSISFPNSIYIIEHAKDKIFSIECYSYKEYMSEETELFEYPLPNELSGNRMCIGHADRTIHDGNVVEALERIIFAPYTHAEFSGMNGFSRTRTYFEYLEKNEFPYKFMKSLKFKLKDVLK